MELRILGPVELIAASGAARLTRQQRTILARLSLDRRRVVPVATIMADLWADDPPARAANLVYNLIRQLRHVIDGIRPGHGAAVVRTQMPGYILALDEVDLSRFEALTVRARIHLRARRHQEAAALLSEALAAWRGVPLGGVTPQLASTYGPSLTELRLTATEDLIDTQLAAGRHSAVVADLTRLVAEHPYRERLRGQLMLALYRSGRQADALESYRQGRQLLVHATGLEPPAALRLLYQDILIEAPGLAAPLQKDGPRTHCRPRVPAHLPATAADFVGRRQHLATLRGALSTTAGASLAASTATIAGPPGIGKTALAVHVAHLARTEYPDGQLFVELGGSSSRPLAPGDALARLIRALAGAGEPVPDSLDEQTTNYRALLAERAVLVVLDDAADEVQVRPLLPGAAQCGALVTSRRPLRALEGATRTVLPPMPAGDCLTLFSTASGRPKTPALAAANAAIVRLCDGLPLAIRTAGIRLATRPHWVPGQLVADLTSERDRLDRLSAGDLDVRARIASAYAQLPEPGQRMLRLASTLGRTPLDPATVAGLLGWGLAEAEAVLDAVGEDQLLRPVGAGLAGAPRYRLPELVRLYAAECHRIEDGPRRPGTVPPPADRVGSAETADRPAAQLTRNLPSVLATNRASAAERYAGFAPATTNTGPGRS